MQIRITQTSLVLRTRPRRKQPHEGDAKTVNGVTFVRRQVRDRDGCYLVRRGRPIFEWVKQ